MSSKSTHAIIPTPPEPPRARARAIRSLAAGAAVAATCLVGARAAAADPPGAGAIWRFDDNAATVTDSSGNGNTGTFVGGASYTSSGGLPPVAGNVAALKLNGGTARVSVPNSASITAPGSWTITAWVRLDAQGNGIVLSKDTTSIATNYNTWIYNNHVRTVVTFQGGAQPAVPAGVNGVPGCDSGGCWIETNAAFVDAAHPLGTWRHVAFTYDDATRTLGAYLDCAVATATFNTQAHPVTSNDAAQIGQRKSNGPEPAINGAIDELKMWARLLSPAEIVEATGCVNGCCGGNACGGCEPPAPLGTACAGDEECASGHCADGVCCDTACGAGPCDACSVAAGAAQDGTCAALTGPACDDGDACTSMDTCQSGACMGTSAVTCMPLDECHEAGTCDPATGLCSDPAKQDGADCDDGDACTSMDTCQSGACMGTSAVTCAPLDECHEAGTCDPATGQCSNPAKPDGTPCSTGTCEAGVCAPASTGGAGGTGAGGTGGTGTGGGGGGGGTGGMGGGGGTGGMGGGGGTAGEPAAEGGCGCRMAEGGDSAAWLAVAGLGLIAARRRRARARGRSAMPAFRGGGSR